MGYTAVATTETLEDRLAILNEQRRRLIGGTALQIGEVEFSASDKKNIEFPLFYARFSQLLDLLTTLESSKFPSAARLKELQQEVIKLKFGSSLKPADRKTFRPDTLLCDLIIGSTQVLIGLMLEYQRNPTSALKKGTLEAGIAFVKSLSNPGEHLSPPGSFESLYRLYEYQLNNDPDILGLKRQLAERAATFKTACTNLNNKEPMPPMLEVVVMTGQTEVTSPEAIRIPSPTDTAAPLRRRSVGGVVAPITRTAAAGTEDDYRVGFAVRPERAAHLGRDRPVAVSMVRDRLAPRTPLHAAEGVGLEKDSDSPAAIARSAPLPIDPTPLLMQFHADPTLIPSVQSRVQSLLSQLGIIAPTVVVAGPSAEDIANLRRDPTINSFINSLIPIFRDEITLVCGEVEEPLLRAAAAREAEHYVYHLQRVIPAICAAAITQVKAEATRSAAAPRAVVNPLHRNAPAQHGAVVELTPLSPPSGQPRTSSSGSDAVPEPSPTAAARNAVASALTPRPIAAPAPSPTGEDKAVAVTVDAIEAGLETGMREVGVNVETAGFLAKKMSAQDEVRSVVSRKEITAEALATVVGKGVLETVSPVAPKNPTAMGATAAPKKLDLLNVVKASKAPKRVNLRSANSAYLCLLIAAATAGTGYCIYLLWPRPGVIPVIETNSHLNISGLPANAAAIGGDAPANYLSNVLFSLTSGTKAIGSGAYIATVGFDPDNLLGAGISRAGSFLGANTVVSGVDLAALQTEVRALVPSFNTWGAQGDAMLWLNVTGPNNVDGLSASGVFSLTPAYGALVPPSSSSMDVTVGTSFTIPGLSLAYNQALLPGDFYQSSNSSALTCAYSAGGGGVTFPLAIQAPMGQLVIPSLLCQITGTDPVLLFSHLTTPTGGNQAPLIIYPRQAAPSASPIPASVSPVPASVSPVPTSASPVPASASPVPASVSPVPTSPSPVPASASPAPASDSPTATAEPPSPSGSNSPLPPSPSGSNSPLPPSPSGSNSPLPPSPSGSNSPLPPSPSGTRSPDPSVSPSGSGSGSPSPSISGSPSGSNTPAPPTPSPSPSPSPLALCPYGTATDGTLSGTGSTYKPAVTITGNDLLISGSYWINVTDPTVAGWLLRPSGCVLQVPGALWCTPGSGATLSSVSFGTVKALVANGAAAITAYVPFYDPTCTGANPAQITTHVTVGSGRRLAGGAAEQNGSFGSIDSGTMIAAASGAATLAAVVGAYVAKNYYYAPVSEAVEKAFKDFINYSQGGAYINAAFVAKHGHPMRDFNDFRTYIYDLPVAKRGEEIREVMADYEAALSDPSYKLKKLIDKQNFSAEMRNDLFKVIDLLNDRENPIPLSALLGTHAAFATTVQSAVPSISVDNQQFLLRYQANFERMATNTEDPNVVSFVAACKKAMDPEVKRKACADLITAFEAFATWQETPTVVSRAAGTVTSAASSAWNTACSWFGGSKPSTAPQHAAQQGDYVAVSMEA